MPTAPRPHRPARAAAVPTHRPPERRLPAHLRGYDADWHAVAEFVRQRDAYLCQSCLRDGRTTPAKTVDHIVPLHVAPHRRLDSGNCEVLCRSHHTRKTASDNAKYGSREARTLAPQQIANLRDVQ